jgi:membrane protease YdiL (CAAX protease family)
MSNLATAIAVQHLLFFFLVVVTPVWDYYDTRRLKRSRDSGRKIRYYRTLAAWLWIATAVAYLAVGFRPLSIITPAPGDASWLFGHAWVRYLVEAVITIFVALTLLPVGIVLWKKVKKTPRKWSSAEKLRSLSFFLPATWTERRWFGFLCMTAGVCEETLFRGFLLHYLHIVPWSLNLTLALLTSSVIFGLQHLYLGARGALQTVGGGFVFGLLFLLTGNLILPILFHAASDLLILLLLRPPGPENKAAA